MEREAKPTHEMREMAERVQSVLNQPMPAEATNSYDECKQFLQENGVEWKAQSPDYAERQLENLKDVLEAMSRSQPKETTLDYQMKDALLELAASSLTQDKEASKDREAFL